jgi:hypothetical protein
MYAQLIEMRLEPERFEVLERVVRNELVPALREQPGFCGALNLSGRERAETLLVLLWETEEDACLPLIERVASFATAFSTVSELLACGSCSVSVWEVDARG